MALGSCNLLAVALVMPVFSRGVKLEPIARTLDPDPSFSSDFEEIFKSRKNAAVKPFLPLRVSDPLLIYDEVSGRVEEDLC